MHSITHQIKSVAPSAIISNSRPVKHHPLLSLSIGKRLALGFLIPLLVVLLALSSIGIQSNQLLTNVATFNQHLLHGYTALTTEISTLQQIHTNIQGTLNDTNKSQIILQTLLEDKAITLHLMNDYDTTLRNYIQQDMFDIHPTLATLLKQAGHDTQITEQRINANQTLKDWRNYQNALVQVLDAIKSNNLIKAQEIEITLIEPMYANAMTSLLILIQFTGGLVPAIHDATMVEENRLLLVMGLSTLSLLFGIAIVTWLISATLVQRLQRFRSVIQSVEQGHFAARVAVEGKDEIALVSRAVNTTLDTIVGLLEETKRQHDELMKGEELKHLHEVLQAEHNALNEANTRLAALATTDVLTNLPNHRALQTLLEQEYERCRRFGHPLSLLFFDGDRFKQVNDTYGHAVGDVVLRELGERASSILRAGDTVGRFGGEEFLVLLPETNEEDAKIVAERLRSTVAASPLASSIINGGIAVTVSVGVANYPNDGTTANEIQEQADQAMYWAKRLGRNQVRTATEAVRANRDAELKALTAHALERQELAVPAGRDLDTQARVEQLSLIYSLMSVLDWREPGMNIHAHEVSDLVTGMARELQFDEEHTRHAATAAFLHDIGKIALPDRLLQQSRQHFSPQEWQLLHQHAELGASIVEASPWLCNLAPAIRHHHEHWDGSGNPDGLQGTAIPLEARLIAIAEAYHAMISDRTYQASMKEAEAFAELERCAGTQFDPKLLPVLRAVLEKRQEQSHAPLTSTLSATHS